MAFFSFSAKTKEEKFWNWFCKNSKMIFNFESNQEVVFDKIQEELQKVGPNLAFEISSAKEAKREFVISADGIIEAFPAVEKLYKAKPNLPEWTFIKFRPRRKVENSILESQAEMVGDFAFFYYQERYGIGVENNDKKRMKQMAEILKNSGYKSEAIKWVLERY